MSEIRFLSVNQVDPDEFLTIVNEEVLRTHLIDHKRFTSIGIRDWINEKLEIENQEGCRIRAINIDGALAGWCGIQPDDNGFELAK